MHTFLCVACVFSVHSSNLGHICHLWDSELSSAGHAHRNHSGRELTSAGDTHEKSLWQGTRVLNGTHSSGRKDPGLVVSLSLSTCPSSASCARSGKTVALAPSDCVRSTPRKASSLDMRKAERARHGCVGWLHEKGPVDEPLYRWYGQVECA